MSLEVKLPKFDPRLDRTGRPWRVDSEWACGMPVGAFMWLKHRKSVAKQKTFTFNGMLMREQLLSSLILLDPPYKRTISRGRMWSKPTVYLSSLILLDPPYKRTIIRG